MPLQTRSRRDEGNLDFFYHYRGMVSVADLYLAQIGCIDLNARVLSGDKRR